MSSGGGDLDAHISGGDLVARGALDAGYRSMCGLSKGFLVDYGGSFGRGGGLVVSILGGDALDAADHDSGGSDTGVLVIGDSCDPSDDTGHDMHDLADGEGGSLDEDDFNDGAGDLSGSGRSASRGGGGSTYVSSVAALRERVAWVVVQVTSMRQAR
jgi:hypothetical protein